MPYSISDTSLRRNYTEINAKAQALIPPNKLGQTRQHHGSAKHEKGQCYIALYEL